MELINWELLRKPANWFVIWTMVILGLFALHFSLVLIHGSEAIGLVNSATRKTHESKVS